ncbi:MAG TPA: polysaccharide deacetylase family protein [Gemmatimonadaceae bacterium]|nr:polysaccharide deacetylase family protein [Gemmatimonadaceae bacterium]
MPTRRARSFLGGLLYRSGMHRRLWKNRAAIVVFHRVDDRYAGDPITCSFAQFRAYCDFFQRYFSVISLSELLDRLDMGRDISRHLVITFDDGYRDNVRCAEELERRRLPACFFVTTEFIDSARNAWWDSLRSIHSEWMTWDDLREIQAHGFEVACHTATHANLGTVSGAQAAVEIVGARERLERELGAQARHFGVPFGRREHLSDANREVVRYAGFRSCLSACGGSVTPGCDSFDLKRVGVSDAYSSPYQFGFEMAFHS